MKKQLALLTVLTFVGCGEHVTKIPNNKKHINANQKRIELLEASDALQNLRLNALESSMSDLEGRVSVNEDAIDQNESDIADLFDSLDDLGDDLNNLRNELRQQVNSLRRADRQTRRLIRSNVRPLRRQLSREIRQRQLADSNLQLQIDSVESNLNRFQARQRSINMFLGRAIMMTNIRITQLQSRVSRDLSRINRRLSAVESDISSINSEISAIQQSLTNISTGLDEIEDKLVSVVFPCGEENSEEVLLKTQDGLVAYFQEMKNETLSFNDSITIPSYSVSGHYDKYCLNVTGLYCRQYSYRYHRGTTIPSKTFNIGDTATIKVLKKAYLDLLGDGNYSTTDGHSCNFTVSNGEIVEQND